jgi:hypothetical protein
MTTCESVYVSVYQTLKNKQSKRERCVKRRGEKTACQAAANIFTHTQASTHMGNGKSFDTHKGQPQTTEKERMKMTVDDGMFGFYAFLLLAFPFIFIFQLFVMTCGNPTFASFQEAAAAAEAKEAETRTR